MTGNDTYVLSGECFHVLYSFQLDYPDRYNWMGIAVCCCVLAPIVTVLNSLILLTVYKKKELWTNTYFFLCGLAFTDLITGVVSLPAIGAVYLFVYKGWMACHVYIPGFALGYILVATSFNSLLLISTDRYVAVFYPYFYDRHNHDRYLALKVTLSCWIITTMLVICSFFTTKFIMYFVMVSILMPLSLVWILFVQSKMVRIVRRVSNEIRQRNEATLRGRAQQRRRYRTDNKVTYLAVVMVIAMVICYMPAVIVLFVVYAGFASKTFYEHRFIAYGWTLVVAYLNSALNPLIFGLRMKEIRKGLKEIIYNLFKRKISNNNNNRFQSTTDLQSYHISKGLNNVGICNRAIMRVS